MVKVVQSAADPCVTCPSRIFVLVDLLDEFLEQRQPDISSFLSALIRIQDRETYYLCALGVRVYDVAVTRLATIRNRRAKTSDHGVSTLNDTIENRTR
jgi:hypothetical protein